MSCPHCGAANDASARDCQACGGRLSVLDMGDLLASRWEVLARLGSGGMGVVYKARDRHLEEVVAIKVLREDMARSPEMARRFLSEIKLARRVRHPNVCAIHEYGQDGDLRFIVMEYVEGVDLKRVLAAGPLEHAQAFAVGAQVAAALQAIHQAGIVHRDLKPANVMLDAQGHVRLMDFGIAKQFGLGSAEGLTATGQIVGTPEYMSPEQVRGEPVDMRSDVYALGVVLYELFTGRVPFRGPTAVATLYQHVNDPVPIEAARAAGAPPALMPILLGALAKSPPDRYASAAEVETALAQARAAPAAERPRTLTLVRAALALQAEAEPDTTPLPAARHTAVPAPTAVPVAAATLAAPAAPRDTAPAPALAPRPVRARIETPRHRGVALAAGGALAALAAAAWLYGPQVAQRLRQPAPAAEVPSAAPTAQVAAVLSTVPAAAVPAAAPSAGPAPPAATPMPPIVPPVPAAERPSPSPTSVRSPSATPPPAAETAASLDHAEELFAQGRFASALAEAKAVVDRQPGNRQAQQLVEDAEVELLVDKRLKEAREAMARGDREDALEKVKLGMAAKPTDARLVALWRELTRE